MWLTTIWLGNQQRTALLVKEGRVYNQFVILDGSRGVRVVKLKKQLGYTYNYETQPQIPAKTYLYMGKNWGITKAAKEYLENGL